MIRDQDEGNIILAMISQLRQVVYTQHSNPPLTEICRIGMDLQKVSFPT